MTDKTNPQAKVSAGEPQDKRRTPPKGDTPVNFVLREEGFVPPFDAVTAVSVVTFTPEGEIVAAEENRGPDLPGGHVQVGEDNPEATARRETTEETGVTLGAVHFLRAIQSDRYGSSAEELTYMVVMGAIASSHGPVPVGMKKHIMTPEAFLAAHRGLRKEMVRELVAQAQNLLFA